MIINGKAVTGLYKYDSESTFTEGDIVYKDSTLYIALTKVSGIDPSDEEMSKGKYTIYLGDKCVGINDYLNYEETEDSKINKYIPANLLPVILNHYLTGLDDKGVITTPDSSLSADDIIVDENINNAIYAVDRWFSGLPIDLYSSESDRLNREKLILKQYTYTEKEFVDSIQVKMRVRVQELIDHSKGMVWYRYRKLDNPQSSNSEWKFITFNSSNVYDNILRLAKEYKYRIDLLRDTLNNIKKNFRYRSLDMPKRKSNTFTIPDDDKREKITVVVLGKAGNGVYESVSFTIDLGSTITKYESNGYYLSNSNGVIGIYEDKNMSTLHRKATINEVFVHEYYG